MYNQRKVVVVVLLLLLVICSLFLGRYPLTLKDVIMTLVGGEREGIKSNLLLQIRIPRILMAIFCGAYLAQAGYVYQTTFKNPLVSPDLLGVSAGATVGAIMGMVIFKQPMLITQLISFAMGIGAVVVAMALAKSFRKEEDISLVLAGIVVGAMLNATIMMLKTLADPERELALIEFWIMGSLQRASVNQIFVMLMGLIPLSLLFLLRYPVKMMILGEEQAKSLGLNYGLLKIVVIICATWLVSLSIMHVGIIAWIGLMVPHIVRLLFGDDYEQNFLTILGVGAIILLLADNLARTLFPVEIPISIITAHFGALFLLGVLWFRRRYD